MIKSEVQKSKLEENWKTYSIITKEKNQLIFLYNPVMKTERLISLANLLLLWTK